MVSESSEASSGGKVKYKLDIAKSIIARCCKRPSPKSRRTHLKKKRSSSSIIRHKADDIGYTVDVADLLFTPDRDFLLKNNGDKVRVDDLKGKTLLLFIVPIYEFCINPGQTVDIIQAYEELLPFGDTEFVFVPVYLDYINDLSHLPKNQRPRGFASQEAFYNHLFSTMPWPAVPFSDIQACGDRIVKTFSVDNRTMCISAIPFWVIIDPTSRVVATRSHSLFYDLFKLFGGAELHPLSHNRICDLYDQYGIYYGCESRKRLIQNWDQLLASPSRDFLLSSYGDKVPISSLKDKVIGLYFCENIPRPPRMDVIKKVYEEAKLRGYDFEIVQINFHYICFSGKRLRNEDLAVQQCYENISWLTLPFKDPSCRKLQRLLKCEDSEDYSWKGDCLVIVDPRQADTHGVHFEFSGAEILEHYGIESYPFRRETLFDLEYKIQKKELNLQSLFPPECLLSRPAGDSQLLGKRVLVFFAKQCEVECSEFVSMLRTKYLEDVAEEDKFEVLYASTDHSESSFSESIKGMPWLVHRHCMDIMVTRAGDLLRLSTGIGAAAFDKHGELIAKEWCLGETWGKSKDHKLQFPFVSQDLRKWIGFEAYRMCELDRYYDSDS